nr:hypothetical protein BaRGS_007699 [Batillaria attramentaria]
MPQDAARFQTTQCQKRFLDKDKTGEKRDAAASATIHSGERFVLVARRSQPRISSATSVMDDKFRGALHRHYRLLMTHITLTDDVINQMAKEKILPETMIKDIQACETKEDRNECLLNSLRLRGNNSYKKFRDLMYRTGNFFVADMLWEEDDPTLNVEEEDLHRFPGLLDGLQEEHRKKLVQYLESKVREKALLLAWREAPKERMQALFNKATNFNQEKIFRDTIMEQEQKVKRLEQLLENKNERVRELQLEVKSTQEQIVQIKKEHRTSMDTQTKFHDANISTISRLRGRLTAFKERAVSLNKQVSMQLGPQEALVSSGLSIGEEDDAAMVLLEKNIKKLLDYVKLMEDEVEKANAQRNDVPATLLNRRASKDPLVSVVKDVLRHEQRHRSIVMRDIMKLGETMKQTQHKSPTRGPPDPATLETNTSRPHRSNASLLSF